jgi:tetratricopeptide (TPR) repeat protein
VTDGVAPPSRPAAGTPVWKAFERAFAHDAAGRHEEARRIYESILAALPEHPGALLKLAQHDLRQRAYDRARERLEIALRAAGRQSLPTESIWCTLGRVEAARGRVDAAQRAYEHCLAEVPASARAQAGLGALALTSGDAAAARAHYGAAVAHDPNFVEALLGLAVALAALDRADEAVATARRGRELAPDEADAWRVEAEVLLGAGNAAASVATARSGLARHPEFPGLLHALGNAYKALGAATDAREVLRAAVALAPDHAAIHASLSGACLDLGLGREAREHALQALALGADGAEVWDNLGLAHMRAEDHPAAARAFAEAVARKPALTPALANLFLAQRCLADWTAAAASADRLLRAVQGPAADPRCPPSIALLTGASMPLQLQIARGWSSRVLPPVDARRPPAPRGARLRVGYLSADFHEHATARLAAGLFEHHDRDRFETFGYSHGPDDGSPMRRRVAAAFAHWRDLRSVGDGEAAAIIEADALDILIDLKGHTLLSRLSILARRPARLQLHYLGYPGTLGYAAIDGIIADHVVAPADEDACFGERVLRLPRCYQVNDGARPLPPPASREAEGLPDDAIVLASFNNPNKLSAEFFAIWMAALSASPATVLWLYAPGDALQRHLRAAASAHGVDPGRIRFAPAAAQVEHIARLRCADLALDVLPYGSHTTGSDALWAGAPMLSCKGSTFAGRVGASLLRDVGLPELVVESTRAYADTLAALVADRDRLHAYRAHLERHRRDLPLFDTAGFTRDFEALLERAYEEIGTRG